MAKNFSVKTKNPAIILFAPEIFLANNNKCTWRSTFAMGHQRMVCTASVLALATARPGWMRTNERKNKFKLKPTFRTKFIGFSSQPVLQRFSHSLSVSRNPFTRSVILISIRLSVIFYRLAKKWTKTTTDRAPKKSCWKAACVRLHGVARTFTFHI